MENRINCKGLYNNYKRMLEDLAEWENVGGYIHKTRNTVGELPYHGYCGEQLEKEKEIAGKIIGTYNNLVNELKDAVGGMKMRTKRGTYRKLKKILVKHVPRFRKNNWRKMHHIPMVRRIKK